MVMISYLKSQPSFSIFCVSLIEETLQNFRLFSLIETDLKNVFRYCNKFWQWNKQTVVEHFGSLGHNDFLIIVM